MVASCFGRSGFSSDDLSTVFAAGADAPGALTNYNASVIKLNVSVSVQKVVNSMHNGLNVPSQPLQCRLYVPLYTMQEDYQKQYLAIGQKKFHYVKLGSCRLGIAGDCAAGGRSC
jgi:hypothetical protein